MFNPRLLKNLPRPGSALPWLAILLLLLAAPVALEAKKTPEPAELLPERYRAWLEDVSFLISKEERELFLELQKDYQRDAFIERFWKVRDPYPRTTRNEFRDHYQERLRYIHSQYDKVTDERAKMILLNGPPTDFLEVRCSPYLWPTEVWYYDGSDNVSFEFFLLFYQPYGHGGFRLWQPFDGLKDLSQEPNITLQDIVTRCGGDKGRAIAQAIGYLSSQGGPVGAQILLSRILDTPEPPEKEWVATFSTYSTDLPEGAATFDAELALDYPRRFSTPNTPDYSLSPRPVQPSVIRRRSRTAHRPRPPPPAAGQRH